MLFNSYEFVFGFLPITLAAFFLIGHWTRAGAAGWLGLASLFFYGWWSVRALPLLVCSIVVNYAFGWYLSGPVDADAAALRRKRWMLFAAISANLVLLGFFKYANFFVSNANAVLRHAGVEQLPLLDILLPIGISFYTFTQIAFLVDCHRGVVAERNFVHYLLFVSYFPHLIAGPVLHHAQMMPQFARAKTYRLDATKTSAGIALFAIGLAKKLLIADPNGTHANAVFSGMDSPPLVNAWGGVLAYAFQIYFDFSGYSDMALGLSLLFGIRLPINFDSPYRATSIIDFWRRWHISLSTFLRDYLYVPLGGNRRGPTRRYANLLATMILGGLWHGASWTFVLWGAAHGFFLLVNHAWNATALAPRVRGRMHGIVGGALTFLAVCFAWVLFRADSLQGAIAMYKGLLGWNGTGGSISAEGWLYLAFAGLLALFPWNSLCLARRVEQGSWRRPWQAWSTGLAAGCLLAFSLLQISGGRSPQFLYFQF